MARVAAIAIEPLARLLRNRQRASAALVRVYSVLLALCLCYRGLRAIGRTLKSGADSGNRGREECDRRDQPRTKVAQIHGVFLIDSKITRGGWLRGLVLISGSSLPERSSM